MFKVSRAINSGITYDWDLYPSIYKIVLKLSDFFFFLHVHTSGWRGIHISNFHFIRRDSSQLSYLFFFFYIN
jgi:hypothetical protein